MSHLLINALPKLAHGTPLPKPIYGALMLNIIALSLSLGTYNLAQAADKPASSMVAKSAGNNDEIVLQTNSPQLASLKIEPVVEVPTPATDPLNGKISFDENSTARISSPIIGRALRINAQIGDKVKAGQPLLVMDSPDLGSALSDARKAQADLQLKRQANDRSKLLLDGGVIARKDYESSVADLQASEAEAERARGLLNNLGAGINGNETYTLRAPMAGVIVDRQINPGSQVRPDAATPLFILTNPDHLWATIDLPERDLGKVSNGQAIIVEVDAYPGDHFQGSIKAIGGMLDPATRRIQVICSVESRGKLKPEMYARITPLSAGNTTVIRVPNSALITEGLYSYVFVETTPNHIRKRRVTLNSQGRDFATVKDGIIAGDRLVTSGAILLNSELSAEN